jgi:hypothetical protein
LNPVSHFLALRGYACENCGAPFSFDNPPTRHHCIEPTQKHKHFLDADINIELVGWTCCHESGKLDTTEHALEFARRQIERGYDVIGWYESLPLKVKRFPNLRQGMGY